MARRNAGSNDNCRMTPREYLEQIVRPNVADLTARPGDMRHAFNAIAAVDALAAHIYVWDKQHGSGSILGADDTQYRQTLSARDRDFELVFETAKASKHVRLTRGSPSVAAADQVASRVANWGDFRWGELRWDTLMVYISPNGEASWTALDVVTRALAFLEREMASLGIP